MGNIDFTRRIGERLLYNLLNTKANIYFDVIDEKFRAVGCPDNVARLLDILPDEPVLRTSSAPPATSVGPDHRILRELSEVRYFYTHTQYSHKQQDSVSTLSCNKIMGCIWRGFGGHVRDHGAAGDREHYQGALEHALDEKRGLTAAVCSKNRRVFRGNLPSPICGRELANAGKD